jgi:hypothetical protein
MVRPAACLSMRGCTDGGRRIRRQRGRIDRLLLLLLLLPPLGLLEGRSLLRAPAAACNLRRRHLGLDRDGNALMTRTLDSAHVLYRITRFPNT